MSARPARLSIADRTGVQDDNLATVTEEQICRCQPRDPAADDADVCGYIVLQRLESHGRRRTVPDGEGLTIKKR